jgi:hypothetical protein
MGATMAEILSLRAKEWITVVLAGVLVGLVAVYSVGPVGAAGDRVTDRTSADTAAQIVDRTQKGDRLNVVFSRTPDADESGRIALRNLMERTRIQDLREACEPPASPYVDPALAKLPGRCLS